MSYAEEMLYVILGLSMAVDREKARRAEVQKELVLALKREDAYREGLQRIINLLENRQSLSQDSKLLAMQVSEEIRIANNKALTK